jgi:hypothetical protein
MTDREANPRSAARSSPDRVVDELVPETVEWERLVRTYPIPALLLAAVGGFVLGRNHGQEVVGALSAFAGRKVVRSVNELLGEDVLD